MSNISQQFPPYTGSPLSRGMTPAEFNAAEVYFQSYHAGFVPTANTWSSQANELSDAFNTTVNQTLATMSAQSSIMSGYLSATNTSKDEANASASASEISYQNTIVLLDSVDISGTSGYTIEAVDDLLSRTRNLSIAGLNII